MFEPDCLRSGLARIPESQRLWIAYSGGLDSQVLLHALAALSEGKHRLQAIHVNHGWHPHAQQWAQRCMQECDGLGISCQIVEVNAQAQKGQSLEALARTVRYEAFAKIMGVGDYLFTAHQQDDQAETLLLQLFRGAGVKGLAAMPEITAFAEGFHVRPLLKFTRKELQAYAEQQGLQWIEDVSNTDRRFDRNYIRHELLPVIQKRWPAAATTLTRSARHCAEAAELIEMVAERDLQKCVGVHAHTLSIPLIKKLTPPRLHNLLRFWLQSCDFAVPSEAQLQQIKDDVLLSRNDACPVVSWDRVEIRRYQNTLYALDQNNIHRVTLSTMRWNDLQKPLVLSGVGTLRAILTQGKGIRSSAISDPTKISVRFRQSGERFQPAGRQGSHPLKKLFQEWRIPPWQRDHIPLLYYQDQLIAVVGFAISAQFIAAPQEESWETSII